MTSRKDGKKIARTTEKRALPAVGRRSHRRAEIGGEGEERPGHSLGGAIAREKSVVAHPALWNDGRLEQRQHHVAAAEHERARAIEHVDELEGLRRDRCREQRKAGQKREEEQDGLVPVRRPTVSGSASSPGGASAGSSNAPADPAEDDHRHLDEG